MFKKLAQIANELDSAGYTELADQIDRVSDALAKEAALGAVLKPEDVRSPDWVAAAETALPLLMKGWGWVIEKAPPATRKPELNLSSAISEIQRLVNANKPKQSGQVK